MNLRKPPPANSVISNPFGAPSTNQNDTSANNGANLFGQADSQSQDNNSNMFVSDEAPSHSGIQFEEDEQPATNSGMFTADPVPS